MALLFGPSRSLDPPPGVKGGSGPWCHFGTARGLCLLLHRSPAQASARLRKSKAGCGKRTPPCRTILSEKSLAFLGADCARKWRLFVYPWGLMFFFAFPAHFQQSPILPQKDLFSWRTSTPHPWGPFGTMIFVVLCICPCDCAYPPLMSCSPPGDHFFLPPRWR